MKIGVKTFDNPSFLKHFEKEVDFFEVMAIEGKNYDFVKELKKPIIIHAQHEALGINNSNKTSLEKSKSSLKFAIKVADMCNAEKIILHPGKIENENCSKEVFLSLIKDFKDERIIVENLTNQYLCSTPEETLSLMKEANVGFCFDINHAIFTALSLKKNYLEMIKHFIQLKPSHYHIGGQKMITNSKGHLSFQDSELDLEKIFKLIPKDAKITLEVTTDITKTEKDIKTIKKFIH